jgi:cytochrome c oxidase assembly protein subunit 15
MNITERRHTWLRRVALLCTAMVFAITSLSAFIRLSQSGLGCNDWPQCYGSRLSEAQHGQASGAGDSDAVKAARQAHRLVAVAALLLVIAMVVLCFGNRPYLRREGALALGLLALALALAVLGRFTAGARLPAVAIGNLLGGLSMLALSWQLAAGPTHPLPSKLRGWALIGVGLMLIQVLLGALVSSSYAGLSCSGAIDCLRTSEATGWQWQVLSPWREPVFDTLRSSLNAAGALTQLAHRSSAALLLLVLLPLGVALLRSGRRNQGALLMLLLLGQAALGGLMVASSLPLTLVLAHNMVAALLMAALLRMGLRNS